MVSGESMAVFGRSFAATPDQPNYIVAMTHTEPHARDYSVLYLPGAMTVAQWLSASHERLQQKCYDLKRELAGARRALTMAQTTGVFPALSDNRKKPSKKKR